MGLAGGRVIEHQGRCFEWVVGRRGPGFRVVAQDADTRGQLLVAWHPVYLLCERNEARGDYFKRTRIGPVLLRRLIDEALGGGWRPECRGLPPHRLGSPGRWPPGFVRLPCLDGAWALLSAVRRDPVWRERLAGNTGEFVALTAAAVPAADPAVWVQTAAAGPLVVYVRPGDYHGDGTPHLAVRSQAWGWDIVLEDISDWHRGWGQPEAL